MKRSNKAIIRRVSFLSAVLLILSLIPGSVFTMAETEQRHNHTEGYCYVCKEGDPSLGFSYNVSQDFEQESPAVAIGDYSFQSLADAVEAADPGDRLTILRSMVLQYPVMIDKDLTLVGEWDEIVISRGFSGEAMFTVCDNATLKVGYLTFDGGSDSGYSGYSLFNVLDGSYLVISNGTTLKNSNAGYGGGVYADENSTVQMNGEEEESQIRQCSADHYGGGIYSEGSVQIFQGASVTGNRAESGGGIWMQNSSVYLDDPGAVYGNTDSSGNESNIVNAWEQPQPVETNPAADDWDPDATDVWKGIHTVYFDPGDGSAPVPVQVYDGETVSEPLNISWDGYTFTGWTYMPYGDGEYYSYDFSQPVYSDLTIYANWEWAGGQAEGDALAPVIESEYLQPQYGQGDAVTYQVSFDYGVEGWENVSQTVASGGYAVDPYDPGSMYREGFAFSGWFYYTNEGEFQFYFDQPVYQNYYLTAKWIEAQPSYVTVTYDPNDGVSPVSTAQIAAGSQAAEALASREGYTFDGWYYYDEYSDYVPYDFSQEVYSDLTLYAEWSEIPVYTVYYDFNANGEIPMETIRVEAGGTCTPPNIARPGYTLENWYIETFDGMEVYDWASPVNYDITLIAQWTPVETEPSPEEIMQEMENIVKPLMVKGLRIGAVKSIAAQEEETVTVSFDANAEDAQGYMDVVKANKGGSISLAPVGYTREGYVFRGWNTQQDGTGVSYADKQLIEGLQDNLSLYAQWNKTISVTYQANSNENIIKYQTIPANVPTALEKNTYAYEGYEFSGWNTDAYGEGTPYSDGQVVTFTNESEDLVLFAQWKPAEAELIYDANGGTGEMPPATGEIGETIEVEEAPFIKGEMMLRNYNTIPDGSGTVYEPGDSITLLQEEEVLYAQYEEPEPQVSMVEFDGNGAESGNVEPITGTVGTDVTVPENGFTRNGWVFIGWNTQKDGDGVWLYPNDVLTLGEPDITLYAQWQEVPSDAKLNYHANGGDGTMTPGIGKRGESIQVAANGFTRSGYTFTGWNTLADGKGESYAAGAMYLLSGTENDLYAQWTPEQSGAVLNYNPNGGEGVMPPGTGKQGSSIQVAANGFTRTGYVFTSWNTLADGTGTAYAPGTAFTLAGAVNNLYAQWEVQTFIVTFDPCNGSNSILQTVSYGQKAVQPEVKVPTGYRLEGWYKEATYVNKFDLDNTPITGSITLFAKWELIPVQYYTVTFYTDKGIAPAAQSVQQGQRAFKPADPTAEGYLFGGWYLDQAYTTLYNFDTPIATNISLYAKWTQRPDLNHVVSFNANGHGNAPNPQTVKGGELAQKPEAPTATGYTFIGWFIDPQCTTAFNFQEPVTKDITLYAGWTVNRYTIRFDSNTGVGTMASIGVAYDQRINLPQNAFTKSGYYFLGWNTAANGTGVFIADQGSVVNLTEINGATVDLYAQWKNIYNIIEGANAQVMKGSGRGVTFRCDGDYSKFTGIKIDGRNVSTTQYTSAPGSTVVTLHEDYVNQIPVGTHTLRFEYTDGGVETHFELLSRTPTTGDTNNTIVWIIIGIAALLIIGGITAFLLIRRRRLTDDDPYFDDFGPGGGNFRREYDDGSSDGEEYPEGYDDGYDDNYNDGYNDKYDDGNDGYDRQDHYSGGRDRYNRQDRYSGGRDGYDRADGYDDPETDEDRYERYVDDQLKRRGRRK